MRPALCQAWGRSACPTPAFALSSASVLATPSQSGSSVPDSTDLSFLALATVRASAFVRRPGVGLIQDLARAGKYAGRLCAVASPRPPRAVREVLNNGLSCLEAVVDLITPEHMNESLHLVRRDHLATLLSQLHAQMDAAAQWWRDPGGCPGR